MTIKEQLGVLKENWLLFLGLLVIVVFIGNFNNSGRGVFDASIGSISRSFGVTQEGYVGSVDSIGILPPGYGEEDFAPEISERKIVKSSSSTIEVERGEFDKKNNLLKNYIKNTNSILLNENVNSYGEGLRKRKRGYYSIQIEEYKYESFISNVKSLGKVESFNENARDITGSYLNLEERLKLENEKLDRYNKLYDSASSIEDKILLSDRIFNQETRIENLKNSLEREDDRISYISASITLNEKESNFIGATIIGIKEITTSFINSLNSVIKLLFWSIPWIVLLIIVRFFWKKFGKG